MVFLSYKKKRGRKFFLAFLCLFVMRPWKNIHRQNFFNLLKSDEISDSRDMCFGKFLSLKTKTPYLDPTQRKTSPQSDCLHNVND